jgi:ribosomal protein S27AE
MPSHNEGYPIETVRRWRRESYHRNKHKHPPKTSRTPRDPIKADAKRLAYNALRRGAIQRPLSCSSCGQGARLHAHHDDYGKPLEVRFLCHACHGLAHRLALEERQDRAR